MCTYVTKKENIKVIQYTGKNLKEVIEFIYDRLLLNTPFGPPEIFNRRLHDAHREGSIIIRHRELPKSLKSFLGVGNSLIINKDGYIIKCNPGIIVLESYRFEALFRKVDLIPYKYSKLSNGTIIGHVKDCNASIRSNSCAECYFNGCDNSRECSAPEEAGEICDIDDCFFVLVDNPTPEIEKSAGSIGGSETSDSEDEMCPF